MRGRSALDQASLDLYGYDNKLACEPFVKEDDQAIMATRNDNA
jgi:hypothetical protein